MSLWSKSVESITADDINNFLLLKEREGPRLDYKADIPANLSKLAAAFANTNGGLIILGVDADKKTNEPRWPRSAGDPGMKPAKGVEERIHQICRDNIHPPVRPQVTPPIDIPGHPGFVVVVVRVDMSPEAPHATNGGRHIYERSGSVTEPYHFAHVDRIQLLLDRRKRLDEDREASIRLAIDRSVRQLVGRRLCFLDKENPDRASDANVGQPVLIPLRWVSVIPYYPWRDLCSPDDCYRLHPHLPDAGTVQRAPGGSFAITASHITGHPPVGSSMLTTKGHMFTVQWAEEAKTNYLAETRTDPACLTKRSLRLRYWDMTNLLNRMLIAANNFYGGRVDVPGHLQVTVGLRDARHFRMERDKYENDNPIFKPLGEPFLDEHFRADRIATFDEFSAKSGIMYDLLDQLADGFDLARLPRGFSW
jgi:Schlafen, AlbA_2